MTIRSDERRCDCTGVCGRPHDGGRCGLREGEPYPFSACLVVMLRGVTDADGQRWAFCEACALAAARRA